MKKLILPLLATLLLTSCSQSEPPELEVRSAETAIRTRYSGANWNSGSSAFIADAAHITDCLDMLPRLTVNASDRLSIELEPSPEEIWLEYYLGKEQLGRVLLESDEFLPTLGEASYVLDARWDEYGSASYYFASEPSAPILAVDYERVGFEDPNGLTTALFETRGELDEFLADKLDYYREAFEKYGEDYFAERNLAIICFYEGSGSIRHRLVALNGSEFTVERLTPEVFTCDMATWTIFVELEKTFTDEPSVKVVEVREGEWTLE